MKEIGKFNKLKHLAFANSPFQQGSVEDLNGLRGLVQLGLSNFAGSKGAPEVDAWIASGNLAGIINLSSDHLSTLEGLDAVEALHGTLPADGNLRSLRSLSYRRPARQQEGSPGTFVNFTGGDQLESLSVENGQLTPLSQLQRFPNIRHFSLKSSYIGSELDLSHFPNLESVELIECDLEQLTNIAAHPNLRQLRLYECRDLQSISGAGQNSTLELLDINGCLDLVAIDGLHQTTNLRTLWISGAKIPAPLGLDQSNQNLKFIRINNCQNLEPQSVER